jgi:hypothetical protein
MMANPGSAELWKGKQIADKLQNRLQESFQAYQDTIVDIERIMKQIACKLDLKRAAEVLISIWDHNRPCMALTPI